MHNPVVSILIPFKNTEDFIVDCLESIIKQTYIHWELLIVDDNSTDSSFSMVETIAQKDNRIKLFKNSGNGIIDALQLAFKQSTGEFITRMDSDDMMNHNKLEILSNNLPKYSSSPIGIIWSLQIDIN